MPEKQDELADPTPVEKRTSVLLWLSGGWVLPLLAIAIWALPATAMVRGSAAISALMLAPLPALLYMGRQRRKLRACAAKSEEAAAQLKLQLETVRYRTARLREELQAADKQARLSHQLTLLGQFTAGFMHEFNNPLAIVEGRLEVLLEERKEDSALCMDLEQMLKETRYMGKIARTLLQALRRERGGEVFEPSNPQKALETALAAFREPAWNQGVELIGGFADCPRVDVPEHVVAEVIRGLIGNALHALAGRDHGQIKAQIEPYRTAGATICVRIEDNGPGIPEPIRQHLFEPFISNSSGREHLGLGLFLAASLLDMYDGRIRYEAREKGGACFVLELPPARFTRGQPYHWFAGGTTE
jgi:signal transduction histidine kinase